MRPIQRGSIPLDATGEPKAFREYQQARSDLIERLGEICSYCEMHLDASLAIEHVQPKDLNPDLALDWDNFLLGCANCNSTKGDQPIVLADYYWPDRDNTMRAFEYIPGGLVQPATNLDPAAGIIAMRTIRLVGLDKIPTSDLKASDRRWNNRREAWDIAERARYRLQQQNTELMREQIIDTAVSKGFWSIWMTVFRDDSDMLSRFIEVFPGTARDCFDNICVFIPRAGGVL